MTDCSSSRIKPDPTPERHWEQSQQSRTPDVRFQVEGSGFRASRLCYQPFAFSSSMSLPFCVVNAHLERSFEAGGL